MICCECGRELRDGVVSRRDVLALNKKLLGRRSTHCFCEDCLAEYWEVKVSELSEMAEEFREQGCGLFG